MDFGYGEKPGAQRRARAKMEQADRDAERRRKELGLAGQAERPSIHDQIEEQHRKMEAVNAKIADPNTSDQERNNAEGEREYLLAVGADLAQELKEQQARTASKHIEDDDEYARRRGIVTEDDISRGEVDDEYEPEP